MTVLARDDRHGNRRLLGFHPQLEAQDEDEDEDGHRDVDEDAEICTLR